MKKNILLAFGAVALTTLFSVRGANETWKVIERDSLNIAIAESETDVENFTARTSKIKGTFNFDRDAKTGTGVIVIDGASLDTGVAVRNEHMKSGDWFNFSKNPDIKFEATRVQFMRNNDYRITGNLTLNGVTKSMIAVATIKITPANDATRGARIAGDSLALTTKFKIKLSDYNVAHPSIAAGRVANEIGISLKTIATNK
ncbi:MAG: YceI family protein [Deinococcales bacterium]